MARLRLSLLGGIEARLPPGPAIPLPGKKGQALLAYLALRPGQAHPRDKLAALLWGDVSHERARHSLRQVLVALRQALPHTSPPTLLEEGETVTVLPAALDVDVAAFEQLVTDGTPTALVHAAVLYEGDLLEGLEVAEAPFEEWLLSERERLRELALEAVGKLLAHQLRSGPVDEAVQTAGRLLKLDPAQESVHRTLMGLYARQGRRGAALRQYQVCVGLLQRELGAEPESETRQLYQQLLQSRPPPAPAADSRRVPQSPAPSPPEPPAPETPLVGRDTELARLRQAREAAWQGQGRLAVILGEAGIGKSRLVEAVVAEAIQLGGRVLLGRAYESTQIIPFGPWVGAVRSRGVIAEVAHAADLSPTWRVELARLFPELGPIASPVTPAPEASIRLFEALAQLLGWLAARHPLLVVLEDLHWADEMSLRLLAFLSRRVAAWPILVLATVREEELAGAPILRRVVAELGRDLGLVPLTLSALSRTDTLTLVQALARSGTEPPTVAELGERLWRVSEGNPFLVVETMRALHEGDAVSTPAELPFPQRVRDTIAGRLDRLGERPRQLVAVGAAIGRAFDFTLLQRAAGLTPPEAAEGVEELVGRRVLHVVGERLDFTHDRIREVAYESLLPPRRQILHEAVARALEAVYGDRPDEVDDRLAFHYSKTTDAEKAVTYLVRFADRAARGYGHTEAASVLREALVHVERLPAGRERDRRILDVILRLAHPLYFLGRFPESLDRLLQHRERLEAFGDPSLAGPYYFWLGHTYVNLGDPAQAAQNAHRAIQQARQCGDEATMGKAYSLLSQVGIFSGHPDQGIEHGEQAVALLERTGEQWWLGMAHYLVGCHYYFTGDFERALNAEARAHAIGEALGDPRLQTYAANITGWIHATTGDWDAGIDACRQGLARSRDPIGTAAALGLLGYAYLEKGDHVQAIALLEQSVQQYREFKLRRVEGRVTAWLGEAYLASGDVDRARELALHGLSLARDAGYQYGVGCAQRALGRIAWAGGAFAEAETNLRAALETFAAIHARFEVGRTHLALAELAQARADAESAAAHLGEAHGLFAALKVPRYVARADTLAARLGAASASSS